MNRLPKVTGCAGSVGSGDMMLVGAAPSDSAARRELWNSRTCSKRGYQNTKLRGSRA